LAKLGIGWIEYNGRVARLKWSDGKLGAGWIT
jgi:hypothetical protein